MSRSIRALVVSTVLLAPATAGAHAYVMEPVSRDALLVANLDQRAYKNTEGPCGVIRGSNAPLPRTETPTQYEVGATITVTWQETIDHRGCFQVLLSEANDEDWQILAQFDDPAGSPDDEITTKQIKLPDGVSCKDCTLAVRQLMTGAACPPNAPSAPATTYYSCADVRIGDFGDAGPTQAPRSDGGAASEPDDADEDEPSRGLRTPVQESGCTLGPGRGSASVLLAPGLAVAVAIARVRRRRRAAR